MSEGGYRMLEEGERIERYDECRVGSSKWRRVNYSVGQLYNKAQHLPIRRPVKGEDEQGIREIK